MAITKVTSGLISADASSIDLNIDAGTLYLDVSENRVGIGTTSPARALEINSGSSPIIESVASGSNNSSLRLRGSLSATHYWDIQHVHSDNDLSFGWSGSEKVRITDAGNVGIGTSSPTGKLGIYGGGINDIPLVITHAWGSSSTALISASNASSEVFKVERSGLLQISDQLSHNSTNAVHYFGANTSFNGVNPAIGRAGGTNYHMSGTVAGDLVVGGEAGKSIKFGTSTSGAVVERMRIDSSGSIGLNTTSLSTEASLFIGKTSSAGNSEGGQIVLQSSANGSKAIHIDNYNNASTDFCRFMRGSDTASEGILGVWDITNVRFGIGTASPLYPLHVDRNATGDIAHFEGQGSTHLRIGEASNVMYLSANNGSAEIAFQSNGSEKMRIKSTGVINSPTTYAQTTSNSANMVVRSGGDFERSTSSERYKNSITDATKGLAELKTLRPVNYKGNNDGDTVFYGLIAEEVHDAGLTEFVEYDDENQPDALRYPHMVSLCVKAIQEQQTIIDDLKTRIETLESA